MTPRYSVSLPSVQWISTARAFTAWFVIFLGVTFVLVTQSASAQNGGGGHPNGHPLPSSTHVESTAVRRPIAVPQVRIVRPSVPANGVPRVFPPRVITPPLVAPLFPGSRPGTRVGGVGFGGLQTGFRPGAGFATMGCTLLWNFGCNAFGYYAYYLPYYGFEPPPKPLPAPTYSEPQPLPPYQYILPSLGSELPETEALKHAETVLYLKDGRIHLLTNYWVEENKLHYKTADGGENTFNVEDIDVEKTMKVNASRGVSFSLHPKSNSQ